MVYELFLAFAGSILLYGFDFPIFVVEVHTMRLFKFLPIDAGKTYMEVKNTVKKCFHKMRNSITIFMP